MLLLALLLLIVHAHTLPLVAEQWLESLELTQLDALHLPTSRISVIKICERHEFIYYGLDNGQVAVSKFGYEAGGHYFHSPFYIRATADKKANIIDVIPIVGECMIVSYESDSKYHAVFIESNYSQSNEEGVSINPLIVDSIDPITLHYNEQRDEMLIFHYNQGEIIRLQIKNMKYSQMRTKEISLNIPVNIDADDQLFCTKTKRDSYILSTNRGEKIVYEMDKLYRFEQIYFGSSSSPKSSALRSVCFYSPSIGFITASAIFNRHKNETLSSIPTNWIEDKLNEYKIYAKSVEAATMIQVGMDLGALLIINDHKSKQLFYLGGTLPNNEPMFNTNMRKLLMAKVRPHAGYTSVKPELMQCHSKRLYVGLLCYINGKSCNIIKKLGSGADGDVFLSKCNSNGADVALKQFTSQSSFNREVKLLSLLKKCAYSTHVVDVYPQSNIQSLTFIVVMEFVRGGDLRNFMSSSGHKSVESDLPIAVLRRYLMDLSEPLAILNNNHNFMHTDVKPENILVSVGIQYSDDEPNIDFILADMSVSMSYDQFQKGAYAGSVLLFCVIACVKCHTIGTAKWFSPEMAAAAYRGVHKMKSKECVDGYGLALVGIHLYSSLCTPKGHTDPLCALANKYKNYLELFEAEYRRNRLRAYERLFEMRSTATAQAKEELNKMADHAQASDGYKRAAKLLNSVSSFLIRSPVSTERYPFVLSEPSLCISWSRFKRQVMDSKFTY